MLNIVVPMAGRGSRFAEVGYELPKPLIAVHGKVPMIRLVIENLKPKVLSHRFIFLVLREHLQKFNITSDLIQWAGSNSVVVSVDRVTDGAACTVLLARDHINNDYPLMIANSDQWVNIAIDAYMNRLATDDLDGLIMTMYADDPKWSYVRLDGSGKILEVVEKQVVSREATVGIYNFKKGASFVSAAESMIAKNFRVNNEFYVAPVYNELISSGKTISYVNVGSVGKGVYGLGTPADLKHFESLEISNDAVAAVLDSK